ncbi:MAG: tRNA (adenosine(37)-N6)-dimethylallyltransferase MiaA [Candidatus Bipolaricaulia bacterium]
MESSNLEPLIILGPTGVGKTAVAIGVAQALAGEIISADSRSFYRELEIGTAKPTAEERRRVEHHLIDIRPPEGRYDVMEFRRDVARLIEEIRGRGRLPIVVGGSTLYIQALIGKLFPGPRADLALRQRLLEQPLEELYIRLKEVDPRAAGKINKTDRQRIVRALEVFALTGRPLSELWRESEPFPYQFLKISLTMDRQALYRRLDERVEQMIKDGLIEEARRLHGRLTPEMVAYRTIGYEESFAYLDGRLSLEEAIALIKRNTRRLAKRQLTFFKRIPDVRWLDVTGKSTTEVVKEIANLCAFS